MTIVDKALKNPIPVAIGIAVVLGAVYLIGRRVVVDVASVPAGIVTGNNVITRGARTNAYEGRGIVGTLGATVDRAGGGFFSWLGERIGRGVYDLTHREYDPNDGMQTAPKTVRDGATATDALWGPIGGVELRSN